MNLREAWRKRRKASNKGRPTRDKSSGSGITLLEGGWPGSSYSSIIAVIGSFGLVEGFSPHFLFHKNHTSNPDHPIRNFDDLHIKQNTEESRRTLTTQAILEGIRGPHPLAVEYRP